MTTRTRTLCLTLALAAIAPAPARAQAFDTGAIVDAIEGTPAEREALAAVLDGDKWVRARELAEKILARNPDSYQAHFVLGEAMHYGEGDLARSARHLEEAALLWERRHGHTATDGRASAWYMLTLIQLAHTYEEMDRPGDELQTLDRYRLAFQTDEHREMRVWPLMKLRRFDDARRLAHALIDSGESDQRLLALTGLCATEFEAGNRDAAYQACSDAIDAVADNPGAGDMEYSNGAEASLAVFKFDEAERYYQESIKRVGVGWANPYLDLAMLYLDEGRVAESIEGLKAAQALRASRPAWLDQYGQARVDGAVAAMLLVVGETERAEQLAERSESRPDRVGVWSGSADEAAAASAVLVSLATREHAARLEEEASTSGIWAATRLRLRAVEERIVAWHERRRAAVLYSDEKRLADAIRPYFVGGSSLYIWMVPELADVVGPGVMMRAIETVRGLDRDKTTAAYLDVFTAQALATRGDWDEAGATAEHALAKLPKAEALLDGRAAAIAAEAARRAGDLHKATELYSRALARDPDVLRRLGLALPVIVESDGSPVADAAADIVARSPRFDVENERGLHVVTLRGAGSGQLEACLDGPRHEMLQCTNLPPEPKLPPKEQARKLVAALHKVAFAYKADLTQADLTTLDGSPTATRAEKHVKSLLDQMGETGEGTP